MTRPFAGIAVLILIILAGVSCRSKRYLPPGGQGASGSVIELLLNPGNDAGLKLFAPASVTGFYEARAYQLAWTDSGRLLPAANAMIDMVREAAFYGLFAEDYHFTEINGLLKRPADHFTLSRLDILLTDGFFALWHHLKYGLLQKDSLTRLPCLLLPDLKSQEALSRAIKTSSIRATLLAREPALREYTRLKEALKNNLDKMHSDPAFEKDDGPDNLARPDTIKKLVINLERWRWEPGRPAGRHLMVNIPAFMLRVIEEDTIRLESRVITGAPETPTPVLNGMIECFVIYPYWHVPRKIATREILPHIQKDTGYIQRHHYDVLDRKGILLDPDSIDWGRYHENNFPFILRQREGAENTLGVIKFVFNNPYGVYLHDTNARGLFKKEYRALSHGCVRLEKARALAYYLVRNDSLYYGRDDLDQYLAMQKRIEITLPEPMPLYIRYFTCGWQSGAIMFYKDIYGLDDALIRAVYAQPLH